MIKKLITFASKGLLASALLLVALVSQSVAIDIDGDSKDEIIVFRPSFSLTDISSVWAVSISSLNNSTTLQYQWGLQGDIPISGNFTSTMGGDITVWRPSEGIWYIREYDSDFDFDSAQAIQWGLPGDTPHACDLNDDHLDDLIVFRESNGTWYSRLSNASTPAESFSTARIQQWGLPGDTSIPGDYDSDGECDYAVYRNGTWFVILSSTDGATAASIRWGSMGDEPVPGLYGSDNILDFAVYRESAAGGPLWLIRLSNLAGLTSSVIQWGAVGDIPVTLDFDGDGETDIAVYRPASNTFFIRTSSSDYADAVSLDFGVNSNDIPVGDRRGYGTDPS